MSDQKLKIRVAIVTGGSAGIGKAIAEDARFMTGAIVPVSGGSECGYKL